MQSIKIGFWGSGQWGYAILLLLTRKYKIDHIVTTLSDYNLYKRIAQNDIMISTDFGIFNKEIFNVIFIAGLSVKIPDSIIKRTRIGIFNFHASLLPLYRGPEPLLQQLLNDEKYGGSTMHKINHDWDTGEIVEQEEFDILPGDDQKSLFFKAIGATKTAINKFFVKHQNNEIEYREQNDMVSTYYRKINIGDYVINNQMNIDRVKKIIRAFNGVYPILFQYNDAFILYKSCSFERGKYSNDIIYELSDGVVFITDYEIVSSVMA